MKQRYYEKKIHQETDTASTTTIPYGSGVIDWWFHKLNDGEMVLYWTDDMPYKYTEPFLKPVVENGVVVEGITQEELDAIKAAEDKTILKSMNKNGTTLYADNSNRSTAGASPIISDTTAFNAWMKDVYDEIDADGTTLKKPPPTERQAMSIDLEDRDEFTFTRFHDEWGYRWRLTLHRDSVNALAISIYDASGNYLYTTGALLAHPDGGWYTECPAGQADANKEDVHFKWLLGSAPISDLDVYKGTDDTKEGVVKSDERYDK